MKDKPKPKRRFFRYSLRTLMIVVTVFCILLGTVVKRARDQRLAVEAILEMGGWVFYEYQVNDHTNRTIMKNGRQYTLERLGKLPPPGPAWLRWIIGDEYFTTVNLVGMRGSQFNDASLEAVKPLTDLKRLALYNTKITDEGLKKLQEALPNCNIFPLAP